MSTASSSPGLAWRPSRRRRGACSWSCAACSSGRRLLWARCATCSCSPSTCSRWPTLPSRTARWTPSAAPCSRSKACRSRSPTWPSSWSGPRAWCSKGSRRAPPPPLPPPPALRLPPRAAAGPPLSSRTTWRSCCPASRSGRTGCPARSGCGRHPRRRATTTLASRATSGPRWPTSSRCCAG
uniref:Putative dual specificity protein phosphatase n=1 Tax=Ixodes ricinus TaxID=34613 RepID=A0A147BQD5_IXORI